MHPSTTTGITIQTANANPQHPLYSLTLRTKPPRLMKQTIFHNNNFTLHIETEPDITPEESVVNTKNLHTKIAHEYLTTRNHNKITNSRAPDKTPQNKHYQEKHEDF